MKIGNRIARLEELVDELVRDKRRAEWERENPDPEPCSNCGATSWCDHRCKIETTRD